MQVGNPCVKKEQMYTPAKGAKMETASATLTMPMSLAISAVNPLSLDMGI